MKVNTDLKNVDDVGQHIIVIQCVKNRTGRTIRNTALRILVF